VFAVLFMILNCICSQKDAKTIEGSLFEALVKVGAVSEDNSDDAVRLTISHRTDADIF
jgi:tRNA pseudouridine38-40 synthase